MEADKKKFTDHLKESLSNNSFVRVTFGKYRGGDKEFENIFVTRIKTKEGEKLSFKFRYRTKDIVKNFDLERGIQLTIEVLGKDFLSATLFTTKNDFTLDYSKKRVPKLHTKKPTYNTSESTQHNRIKNRFVDTGSKYLNLLGITSADGKVKSDKNHKFKQVDKFIEILDSLYRDSSLVDKKQIKILDLGSGKSYLTFAMYDYFRNTFEKNVVITGIEQRDDLVRLSNNAAEACGFDNLKFRKDSIENIAAEDYDIATALHACDTATDDAIVMGLNSKVTIMILAPCCHKYLRKKINVPASLNGIYKHGILLERLAVTVTDALRALTLEYFGYDTRVFEFISPEHTAKNTMITAVKKASINEPKSKEIIDVKREFNIDDFYLDKKLPNMKSVI